MKPEGPELERFDLISRCDSCAADRGAAQRLTVLFYDSHTRGCITMTHVRTFRITSVTVLPTSSLDAEKECPAPSMTMSYCPSRTSSRISLAACPSLTTARTARPCSRM